MITHEAALLGPQGHDHPLGCRHLHLLGDAPQRHRGPHLGGSSSVRWSSRKGLACSSSSSSGDESFCTCWEHTWNLMMLCSLMRMARLVTLQPVLSGRAFFGACVCCRVSTRVVQTCAVTCHRPFPTHPSPPPTLEERGGRMQVWPDQGHSYQGQPVIVRRGAVFLRGHRCFGPLGRCAPPVSAPRSGATQSALLPAQREKLANLAGK